MFSEIQNLFASRSTCLFGFFMSVLLCICSVPCFADVRLDFECEQIFFVDLRPNSLFLILV